jgi:peptide chain release factor 3
MQVFTPRTGLRHPIIGVVGPLQFDVVEARLQSEYGIRCSIEALPHVAARWPVRDLKDATSVTLTTSGALTVRDRLDREVILFESAWELRYAQENNPHVEFKEM